MKINDLLLVNYISRPNRFTVEFKNNEKNIELAHLHDPGRLKELLIENTEMLVKYVPTYKKTGRKTKYDVIAVKYLDNWVLLNSSFHNKIVSELIDDKTIDELSNFHVYKPEYSYGNSRLDFLLKDNDENKMFLEVKGCTLVVNDLAMFPDAPTTRGKKHLTELIRIKKEGLCSSVIILVLQNSAKYFSPNYKTDIDFSETFEEACANGLTVLPVHMTTKYEKNSLIIEYDNILPIKLRNK